MRRFWLSPFLSGGLLLATLLAFAAQPFTFTLKAGWGGVLLMPTLGLATLAAIVLSAQAFPRRPWVATCASAVGVAAFVWGEAYAATGLDVMLVGRMDWWAESVAWMMVLFMGPLALLAAVLSHVLARYLGEGLA